MGLNNASLNLMADEWATIYTHLSLHTAAPDIDTGTNESTAGRVAASWPAASGSGDLTITNKAFTGGASGGACTHVGFWTLATGGTFGGFKALTGDQTFNAAGEYTITTLTVDGSSAA
jgi:hypothetical protein